MHLPVRPPPGRRVDFLKPGNPDFGRSGNPDFRKSRILGPGNPEIWDPKNGKKIKILKIQIRSAQNVGKVWISRKKILPALFGAISSHFFHRPEKLKKCQNFAYFPWWANGPLFTRFGPLLLSTRGGGIGISCQFPLVAALASILSWWPNR